MSGKNLNTVCRAMDEEVGGLDAISVSATDLHCDLGKVTLPSCASVSSGIKWGK